MRSTSSKRDERNDSEILERGVASHPGIAGGVGPGQCRGTETGSYAAVRDDHRVVHVFAALADCLPPRWADAGDREDRANFAGIRRGAKGRAFGRYTRGLLAGPERHAGGLRLTALRHRPEYLYHLHRAGRLWRPPSVCPRPT